MLRDQTQEHAQPMAKEWIESLAQDIKQRNHQAAEEYSRAQYYAGVISTQGKQFFLALVQSLQENVAGLRTQLEGDLTSSETRVQTTKADEVKVMRTRFPYIDARLTLENDTIKLDYATGPGVQAPPDTDRKTQTFAFEVAADDTLLVRGELNRRYDQAEDLARHITEMLFGG